MIYLNPENASALGDDTFWTWFKREFPSSRFGLPRKLGPTDIVIQYSTLGFPMAGRSVALLLELYPEMRERFESKEWDERLKKVYEAAQCCTFRVVPNIENVKWYEQFGMVDVIPIGVDTKLFSPICQQDELRRKHKLPIGPRIGFWGGTTHTMKGYDLFLDYASKHPDIFWIVVWKWEHEAGSFQGRGVNYTGVPQRMLNELLNCADFFLCTGRLSSFYMLEWEAMATSIEMVLLTKRDFVPGSYPREDVYKRKWDRESVKKLWIKYLTERGVTW